MDVAGLGVPHSLSPSAALPCALLHDAPYRKGMPEHTVLDSSVPDFSVLDCTILCYAVLDSCDSAALDCTALCWTSVLLCTGLYLTGWDSSVRWTALDCSAP